MMYSLSFTYSPQGRGLLYLMSDDVPKIWIPSRTGSIGVDGKLKNAIEPKCWTILSGPEVPVPEEYDLMHIKDMTGIGWKIRLGTGHYLIHPDGSKNNAHDGNGTSGCIGLQNNGMELYGWFVEYFKMGRNPLVCEVKTV